MDAFEHAGQIICSVVRCLLVDSGLLLKMWGNSCPRRFASVTVYHIQGFTWNSDQAALWQGSRFVAREDHRCKNVCPREGCQKAGIQILGSDAVRLQRKETHFYRIWNPKTRKVAESRNATFIDSSHLIPQSTGLCPLRELPPVYLNSDFTSRDKLVRGARDYTVVLDFNLDIPDKQVDL